jgi:hypothetical protein
MTINRNRHQFILIFVLFNWLSEMAVGLDGIEEEDWWGDFADTREHLPLPPIPAVDNMRPPKVPEFFQNEIKLLLLKISRSPDNGDSPTLQSTTEKRDKR